jgi:hypothetical protein
MTIAGSEHWRVLAGSAAHGQRELELGQRSGKVEVIVVPG